MRISDWSSDVCSSDLPSNASSASTLICAASSASVTGAAPLAGAAETAGVKESRATAATAAWKRAVFMAARHGLSVAGRQGAVDDRCTEAKMRGIGFAQGLEERRGGQKRVRTGRYGGVSFR